MLEFLWSSGFDLGSCFLFLASHFDFLAVSLIIVVKDFLLVFGLFPILFFIFDGGF